MHEERRLHPKDAQVIDRLPQFISNHWVASNGMDSSTHPIQIIQSAGAWDSTFLVKESFVGRTGVYLTISISATEHPKLSGNSPSFGYLCLAQWLFTEFCKVISHIYGSGCHNDFGFFPRWAYISLLKAILQAIAEVETGGHEWKSTKTSQSETLSVIQDLTVWFHLCFSNIGTKHQDADTKAAFPCLCICLCLHFHLEISHVLRFHFQWTRSHLPSSIHLYIKF